MASEKIIKGKTYSLMLGKFGTYFVVESTGKAMHNEMVLNLLNDKFNAIEENAKDFIKQIKEQQKDIERYQTALENQSAKIDEIVAINRSFALEGATLLRKYEFKVPFPDCIQKSMFICKNGISAGSSRIIDTYACIHCKNRNISKLLKESMKITKEEIDNGKQN